MASHSSVSSATNKAAIQRALQAIGSKGLKVVVVGDVLLDQYIYCFNKKVSPEAPAPILQITQKEFYPGGAANTAANSATLNAEVTLFGLAGNDAACSVLTQEVNDRSVEFSPVFSEAPTTVKSRIICDGEYQFRLDDEQALAMPIAHAEFLAKAIVSDKPDLILVSDYHKGTITGTLLDALKQSGLPIYGDPKPEHVGFFKGTQLISPNFGEACLMSPCVDPRSCASWLAKHYQTTCVVTCGPHGAYGSEDGNQTIYAPALNVKVDSVAGAGDTFLAAYSAAHARGCSLSDSMEFATFVSSIATSKPGTAVVTIEEIKQWLQE